MKTLVFVYILEEVHRTHAQNAPLEQFSSQILIFSWERSEAQETLCVQHHSPHPLEIFFLENAEKCFNHIFHIC